MANDLFRMVSLRHSKASRDTPSRRDPRLRYRPILKGQAKSAGTESPRDAKLRELKARHAGLSRKLAQLESVQRAVINAYMTDRQQAPKTTRPPSRNIKARNPTSRAPAPTGATPAILDNPSQFFKHVEKRLSKADAAVFQDVLDNAPPGTLGNVDDLIGVFEVGGIVLDANSLCMQIRAIEENLGDALPTVPTEPIADDADPIVAAVGWGDLIVARESLVGYDAREIAHIENILPGESKLREHQRLTKTEEGPRLRRSPKKKPRRIPRLPTDMSCRPRARRRSIATSRLQPASTPRDNTG
jgi:hypothetical protein